MDFVTYEQFGAKADGKTDDFAAIIAAHNYANEHGLPVRGTPDAHYYIGGAAATAVIRTDTDWRTARFTIDDRHTENNKLPVFRVESSLAPLELKLPPLSRGQKNAGVAPGVDCYVVVSSEEARRYIRWGGNQNNGSRQTDNFELKADGTIAHELVWDFRQIDYVRALPIDPEPLTVRGGYFTTIANEEPSTYNYYERNIRVSRSNTRVVNLHHFVENEGEHGAPYDGFLNIGDCAHVTVESCFFTGRKTFWTTGSAGTPVPMGSYDIIFASATDITLKNCMQDNILDRSLWGVIGSNFSKNIVLDGCVLSRMDAHQGVYNCTLRNSTIGHCGFTAIGNGALVIENCELYGGNIINFRSDYGSHWDGEAVIRNVVWHPYCGVQAPAAALFSARNHEDHDFGYPCTMPHRITLENVTVDDKNVTGPVWLWNNYNAKVTPEAPSYRGAYPYETCDEMILKNVRTVSGREIGECDNALLHPAKKITRL